ncbi:MAG: hypothetical protein ACF8OB_04985 [Phycisphaeraceae bacterium JB051]
MVDYLLDAVLELLQWASDKAQELFGFDITDWDIVNALAFARDSILFCDNIFPMVSCMQILLAGFAAKVIVMSVRYILGWCPTIEG